MLQNYKYYIFLTIAVLGLGVFIFWLFTSNSQELQKSLLKREKLLRDSIHNELKIIHQERDLIEERLDSMTKSINKNEIIVKNKIHTFKYEPKKTVDYTNINNDSLLQRLLPKN
jgi:hypothetical protein